jgi:hypothetical protein
MFKAFEKYCRLPGGGYTGIADVENGVQVERLDKMETFWLSETLSKSGCADVVLHSAGLTLSTFGQSTSTCSSRMVRPCLLTRTSLIPR